MTTRLQVRHRILHVSPVLFGAQGAIGGGERYPLELALAMAERIPTTLVCFGASRHTRKSGKLEIEVIPNWLDYGLFRFDPFNPLLLGSLSKAEVIHCHQSRTMMSSLALLYGRATGKAVFTTHHGGGGFGMYSLLGGLYDGRLHVSAFSKRVFGRNDPARDRVILGGVDANRYAPDPIADSNGEVLYVGRFLPHKGINYLIDAVDKTTPLRIMGRPGGPWRNADRYYRDLQKLASGKRVVFQTNATDTEIIQACQRSLCIVLPSVYADVYGGRSPIPELLGLTAIEGMACGLPAIVTDVASLPEVVEDGVTGFVVEPNNPDALAEKIQWLRAHPAAAREMGAAARQRVLELFTWERVVDRCLQAYGLSY